ncbi:MAG: VOC family protein [Candidatus Cyclobacteriaceae bacterium M3_2C_046]
MQINQIKETCLYVHDLALIQWFYHQKLGLPIISMVENRHIFFRAGTSVLLCFIPEVTKEEKNLPPHYAQGNQHIAFEVDPENYTLWVEKIKSLNIEITHQQKWKDNLSSFYFNDPEGNVLEIVPKGVWD